MKRAARALKAFGTAIGLLRGGRVAIPLALYFLLKLGIVLLYMRSTSGFASNAWAILRFGSNTEALSHYPGRLIIMPIVLGRLDVVLEILVLSFAQGMTVLLAAAAARGERTALRSLASRVRARYGHLAAAAAIISAALIAALLLPMALVDRLAGISSAWKFTVGVVASIIAQSFCLYAVPFIVLEGRTAIGALKRSTAFAARHFIESFVLVAVPFVVTLPALLLILNPRAIALRISPEFLVYVQIAREFAEFAGGYLLVGGLTVYFLAMRENKEK